MLRSTYEYNRKFNKKTNNQAKLKQLFDFTGASSHHHVPIPSNWIIDWRRFFHFEQTNIKPNPSRKINPFLTQIQLSGSQTMNLASRDLKRGVIVGLPSGQRIADFWDFNH